MKVNQGLPTRVNLQRRQIQVGELTCPFYRGEEESAGHLFFQCGKDNFSMVGVFVLGGFVGCFPKPPQATLYPTHIWSDRGNEVQQMEMVVVGIDMDHLVAKKQYYISNGTFDANRILDNAVFLLWTWLTNLEKDFNMHFNFWSSNIRAGFLNRG